MTFLIAEETALKTLIQGITVSDENSSSRPMKVWFGMPDIELTLQEYPYATIDLIDVRPANDRQHSGVLTDTDLNGTVAEDPNLAYRYEIPVAYDLVYQITTYARHPRHDRAIITEMLQARFPSKFGHLDVPNEIGTVTTVRHMFLDEFLKRDYVEEGRRLFRNVFTVRIVSEMSRFTAANALTIVQERFINTNPEYIPSGFDTV